MLAQHFDVYPAIDVLGGQAVRLREGAREEVTVEAGDPAALAARWVAEGAEWVHLVDLEGAFGGGASPALLRAVARAGARVQVGGGYRTSDAIASALAGGAERVIVGTAALEPGFVADAARRFGDALVVAIDVRDGRVAVDGWLTTAELPPLELAQRCADAGVTRLLVTSVRRDGSLAGPDLALLAGFVDTGMRVLAAGGISSLADIRAVRELGCDGAVVGSALLLGRFTLAEAVSLAG